MAFNGKLDMDGSKLRTRIQLRPYQRELAKNACEGQNTIICAPTGSGKTLVAAHIIQKHFEVVNVEERVKRVVLLAPTVPLVDQHTKMLTEYLGTNRRIVKVNGALNLSSKNVPSYVLSGHIIIATPQIFVNGFEDAARDKVLQMFDFTLLIFDECHHCSGNHPYSAIMKLWRQSMTGKPQIVGMTASLPIRIYDGELEKAFDSLLELCSRMSALSLSTVRQNLSNLKEFVHSPQDEIETVLPQKPDLFAEGLMKCCLMIQKLVQKAMCNIGLSEGAANFPSMEPSGPYISYVNNLKASITPIEDESWKYLALVTLEQLLYYCRALDYSYILPNRYAYEFLKENKDRPFSTAEGIEKDSVRLRLETYFKDNIAKFMEGEIYLRNDALMPENKKILTTLMKILQTQFTDVPLSRVLIFVSSRYVCGRLAHYLNSLKIEVNNGEVVEVGHIISSCSNLPSLTVLAKQSISEQRATIDNFNAGVLKILVATSVADEGLDISTCNLVIKYNCMSSQTSLIQRRGRARARESRSILLAVDYRVEASELDSIDRQQLMDKCIAHSHKFSREDMEGMIKHKSKIILSEKPAKLEKLNDSPVSHGRYSILCKMCQAVICESSSVKIAHDHFHICCDPEIWRRLHLGLKSVEITAVVPGKSLFCRGNGKECCNMKLGSVCKIAGVVFSALLIKSVAWRNENDPTIEMKIFKKWSNVCEKIFIDSIDEDEMKRMASFSPRSIL